LSVPALSCVNDEPCGMSSMEIFLPEIKRFPASNIRIEKINFQSESGNVNSKITIDELNKIQESLNEVSVQAFQRSITSFEVLAQFKVTSDSITEFKMQTTGGEKEDKMLTSFYNSASKITEYKSVQDDVYVVIHYKISPVDAK